MSLDPKKLEEMKDPYLPETTERIKTVAKDIEGWFKKGATKISAIGKKKKKKDKDGEEMKEIPKYH